MFETQVLNKCYLSMFTNLVRFLSLQHNCIDEFFNDFTGVQ